MKKMFEFATRGKEELDFSSPKFNDIKEMVKRELKNKMGEDIYEEFSFQCNCTQMLDEEKEEYIIFIKVYGWPKNLENITEENFYLNTNEMSYANIIPTNEVKQFAIEKIRIINNEIKDICLEMEEIRKKISKVIGKKLSRKSKKRLKEDINILKTLKKYVEDKNAIINYYKSEFDL